MSGVEWREPWFSRGPGAPQLDPLPAQLSLLTGLEELQLGYQDRLQVEDSTQNIWRVESVALLQPLAGALAVGASQHVFAAAASPPHHHHHRQTHTCPCPLQACTTCASTASPATWVPSRSSPASSW